MKRIVFYLPLSEKAIFYECEWTQNGPGSLMREVYLNAKDLIENAMLKKIPYKYQAFNFRRDASGSRLIASVQQLHHWDLHATY